MKKILAVLLSVLLLGMPTLAADFADTAGQGCAEAVEVLSAIGVLTGKTETEFAPADTLTRAEMVTIMVRLQGISNMPGGASAFSDVPGDHWAAGNISLAYRMGIVNGVGEGLFQPEAPVSRTEAVKMMVATLGYTPHAEAAGGYPSGYLTKAAQLEILDRVTTADGPISRGDTAILVYNALEVALAEKADYGTDSGKYTVGARTLLDYMGIKSMEGQVRATYFAEMDPDAPVVRENEFAVGDTVFADAAKSHEALIGKKVYLYYKDTENENTALCVLDKSKETLTVAAEDILDKTTASVFWYEEGGKEKSVSIDNAAVLYNGETAPRTPDFLSPAMGTVTLIANGGQVDVIRVDAFVNCIVSSVSSAQNKVFFMGGQAPLELDSQNAHIVFTDNDDKKAVTVYDLIEWDVVSVAKNANGTKVRAIRSVKTVEGTVNELSEKEAVIDGVAYKIAPNIKSQGLDMPTLGMQAVFHLDHLGNIAAADMGGVRGYKYGFLVAADMTKGLNGAPQLKIFTENGEMQIFETTEKVETVAGTVPAASLLTTETGLWEDEAAKRQLVRYEANADGKIRKIETAVDYIYDYNNPLRLEKFSTDYYIDEGRVALGDRTWQSMFIGGDHRSFGGRFLMRTRSKVFVIPGANAKDEEYKLLDPAKLTHGNDGENYNRLTFYDVDEDFVVSAMVWDVSASGVSNYPKDAGNTALVTGFSTGLDADGVPTKYINILTGKGEKKQLTAEDGFMCLMGVASTTSQDPYAPIITNGKRDMLNSKMPVSGINPGDVIRYETASGTNRVTMICLIYRAKTPGGVEFLSYMDNIYSTSTEIVYRGGNLIGEGEVVRNGKEGLILRVQLSDTKGDAKPNAFATRVYPFKGQMLEFDLEKGTYREIGHGDFAVGEKITSIWGGIAQEFLIRYKGR